MRRAALSRERGWQDWPNVAKTDSLCLYHWTSEWGYLWVASWTRVTRHHCWQSLRAALRCVTWAAGTFFYSVSIFAAKFVHFYISHVDYGWGEGRGSALAELFCLAVPGSSWSPVTPRGWDAGPGWTRCWQLGIIYTLWPSGDRWSSEAGDMETGDPEYKSYVDIVVDWFIHRAAND